MRCPIFGALFYQDRRSQEVANGEGARLGPAAAHAGAAQRPRQDWTDTVYYQKK